MTSMVTQARVGTRRTLLTVACTMAAIVAVPAVASATAVSGVTATANTFAAGATRVVDDVGFKAKTALAATTGFIQLKAPAGSKFSSTNSDYQITDGASAAYAYYVIPNPESLGENVVDVYLPFSVAAADAVHVTAFGNSHPNAAAPTGEFAVSTSSDVTAVKKPFVVTAATAVSSVSASANVTSAGAKGVVDTVSFKATGALTNGKGSSALSCCFEPGFVQLRAPAGTEFTNTYEYTVSDGSASATTYGTVNPEGVEGGTNVVNVSIPEVVPVSAGDTVQVVAKGVSNPKSAAPAGEFAVSTSSDVTQVKKPFAITNATSVSALTVSANTTAAGATRVVDQVSFKVTNPLPAESGLCIYYGYGCHTIRLQGPAGSKFSSTSSDYQITDGSTTNYAYYVISNPESLGENIIDVYLYPEMGIAAGDTVQVTAFGVSNPTSAVPSGEFAVSTSSDTVPVAKPFAITAATAVSSVSASANVTSAGAKGVVDTVSFKATGALTNGKGSSALSCCFEPGFVQLRAPAGTEFTNTYEYTVSDGSASATTYGTVNPEGVEGGTNVVNVAIPEGVPVSAGDTVQVVAKGVSNPKSAAPAGEFGVSTSSDVTQVNKPFAITNATSVSALTVAPNTAAAGATRVVDEVSFKVTNPLPAEGGYCVYTYGCHTIRLQAPAGSKFSPTNSDYQITDGSTTNYAYYVIPNPEGLGENIIDVYVYPEMGIAAGDTVHVTAFGASNPTSAAPLGEFAVSTSSDATPVKKPFAITAATAVSSVSATASDYSPGAKGVTDTVGFKAKGPLTNGKSSLSCCSEPGFVELRAPAGTEFTNTYEYTVTDGVASATTYGTVNPEGVEGGANVVDVSIPEGVPVSAGDTVQVVAKGVSNPASAVPTGEFGVSTSSDVTQVKVPFPIVSSAPPPSIEKLKPTSGGALGGTKVTIYGKNLTGAFEVKFGGVSATGVTVQTIKGVTSVTAVSPAHALATVDVRVTTPGGTSAIVTKDRYKYTPTVTGLSPTSGSKAGGTVVTVTGTSFAVGKTGTTFKFGTVLGTAVNCATSTECTVAAPAHAVGKVDVKATVLKLASAKNVPADQFTYN
jgi:hypothetical protein